MASLFSFSHGSSKLSLFLNISFAFLVFFYLTTYSYSTNNPKIVYGGVTCNDLSKLTDYRLKCSFVKSRPACKPQGHIDYLRIFYCDCGKFPLLGYSVLIVWLLILFYLLGDTAANYFCPSLENLSRTLKLPPTIAGVTLLSLGNGAPDVFSSLVSFEGSKNGELGINTILGGAIFVSCFVAGTICVLIGPKDVSIDRHSFVRDVVFLLVSVAFLFLIVFIGKTTVWLALSFVSLYILYVGLFSASHFFRREKQGSREDLAELGIPLIGYINDEKPISTSEYDKEYRYLIPNLDNSRRKPQFMFLFLQILDLPLYLPRRLTIPVVREDRWSKPYAVISVTLSPVLISILFNFRNMGSETSLVWVTLACFVGLIFGGLAVIATKRASPPKKWLLPWLAGGFVMSVTWTYVIAQELVSLLVAFGNVFEISPSVLGLTVLAWGNCLGDLISNVTMAMKSGPDGAQIALSGCYAGPIFNIVVGIGLPLVISSLTEYPRAYVVISINDGSLYETLGFLTAGLLLAIVVVPSKNMKLDRLAGCGMLAVYFCFLFLRLARTFGILST